MPKLYLSHPTLSRQRIREWELEFEKRNKDLDLANPFYDGEGREDIRKVDLGRLKPFSSTLHAQHIHDRDLSLLDTCDGVLAVITGEFSIGTYMEMYYARERRFPVFVICLEKALVGHPWVRYCTVQDGVFTTFDAFEKAWTKRHEIKPIKLGLVGKKGSGKSSIGKFLVEEHGFTEFAFAEELKLLTMRLFGFSRKEVEEKPPPVRTTLQSFASEYARKLYPDLWVQPVLHSISRYLAVALVPYVVVTDVRFQNEAEALRNEGFSLVRIRREDSSDQHISETEQDQIAVDYEVENLQSITHLNNRIEGIVMEMSRL